MRWTGIGTKERMRRTRRRRRRERRRKKPHPDSHSFMGIQANGLYTTLTWLIRLPPSLLLFLFSRLAAGLLRQGKQSQTTYDDAIAAAAAALAFQLALPLTSHQESSLSVNWERERKNEERGGDRCAYKKPWDGLSGLEDQSKLPDGSLLVSWVERKPCVCSLFYDPIRYLSCCCSVHFFNVQHL